MIMSALRAIPDPPSAARRKKSPAKMTFYDVGKIEEAADEKVGAAP